MAPFDTGALSRADRLRELVELLEAIGRDWSVLDDWPAVLRARLHRAVADVFQPDPGARRLRVKAARRGRKAAAHRRADVVLDETGIRALRRRPVFTTPNVFPPPVFSPDDVVGDDEAANHQAGLVERHCYICKTHYSAIHHFYDQLCPACAAINYAKRTELADLGGRVALLTGGRVKIGYQAGLKLLRSGAHVIVTTRFPNNAAERYAAEADFAAWRDRLEIVGLDLRHTPSVEAFCREFAETRERLDVIVNNACQTVRRPQAFYAHMLDAERQAEAGLCSRHLPIHALAHRYIGRSLDFSGPAAADASLFPAGQLDADLQQVDLRGRNSWRLLLDEVSAVELLEVHLVNAVAPFIFNARLRALMRRTPGRDKHIVNVSAVEGQFYRRFKTTRHPHTNMAKAALNMMTRTAAADYAQDGIHMNSVDTGWITDEDPAAIAAQKRADHRFHPPLDIVDGAARILDPVIDGINTGRHVWGQFLKDYQSVPW